MDYNDYFEEPSTTASLEEKIAIIKRNKASDINMLANLRDCKRISSITSLNLDSKVKEENSTLKNLYNRISLLTIDGLSEEEIITCMKEAFQ